GEESGGLSIGGHIPEKDGILANLLILEALAYEQKPLCRLTEELHQEIGINYINHRIDLKLTNDLKETAMKFFKENTPKSIGNITVKNIKTIDGIKIYFEDESWMLIRPSGTEPLLRIYFETNEQNKLDNFINDTKKIISKF
ncbi:MAG: hypothetical protein PHV68_04430, partial [Candidatus Gastranaerophilales bacterium]|nr:hypothetical protein [Candidatus Gastranaerophilales bacterium]